MNGAVESAAYAARACCCSPSQFQGRISCSRVCGRSAIRSSLTRRAGLGFHTPRIGDALPVVRTVILGRANSYCFSVSYAVPTTPIQVPPCREPASLSGHDYTIYDALTPTTCVAFAGLRIVAKNPPRQPPQLRGIPALLRACPTVGQSCPTNSMSDSPSN